MFKYIIKEYLSRNPFGMFLVLLHWGIIFSGIGFLPYDSVNSDPEASPYFLPFLLVLLLDLPVIAPAALILSPIWMIFGATAFFVMFAGVCFVGVTFQWFYIGRKICNFVWKDGTENEVLSITSTTDKL